MAMVKGARCLTSELADCRALTYEKSKTPKPRSEEQMAVRCSDLVRRCAHIHHKNLRQSLSGSVLAAGIKPRMAQMGTHKKYPRDPGNPGNPWSKKSLRQLHGHPLSLSRPKCACRNERPKLSDGAHEARPLKQERDAPVRCSAGFGYVIVC